MNFGKEKEKIEDLEEKVYLLKNKRKKKEIWM